jgi:hypothetical protein
LKANSKLARIDINELLRKYRQLKTLQLSPWRQDKLGAYLVDEVGKRFTGHPSLRKLVTSSEAIVQGAINCPQLTELTLTSNQWGWEDTDDVPAVQETRKVRDVAYLLEKLPRLEVLCISHPALRVRKGLKVVGSLTRLDMTNVRAWVLSQFLHWVDQGGLPHLKKVGIESELHLPTSAIHQLRRGCPQLTHLRLSHLTLAPDHVTHIACVGDRDSAPPWSLKSLHLYMCHIPLPITRVAVYASLVKYITDALPSLSNIRVIHCPIIPSHLPDISSTTPFSESDDSDSEHDSDIAPNHTLRSLDIFETGVHTPSKLELLSILKRYQALSSLHTCAFNAFLHGPHVWDAAVLRAQSIKKLHIRSVGSNILTPKLSSCQVCAHEERTLETHSSSSHQTEQGTLQQISNWPLEELHLSALRCGQRFLRQTLFASQAHLKRLTMDFLAPHLFAQLESLTLPSLTHLTARFHGQGAHSHLIVYVLHSLAAKAPRLTHLEGEALYMRPESLDSDHLAVLLTHATQLRHLSLRGFFFSTSALRYITSSPRFSHLSHLAVVTHSRHLDEPQARPLFSLTHYEGEDSLHSPHDLAKQRALSFIYQTLLEFLRRNRTLDTILLSLDVHHAMQRLTEEDMRMVDGEGKGVKVASEQWASQQLLKESPWLEDVKVYLEYVPIFASREE